MDSMTRVGSLLLLASLAAGCAGPAPTPTTPGGSSPAPGATAVPSATPVPSASPAPTPSPAAQTIAPSPSQLASPAVPLVLSASEDGLSLSVTPADAVIEPGGTATISVTIHNGRPVPVVLQAQRCGAPALMSFLLPFPVDPVGRAWTGIAGEYKAFALGQTAGSGGFLQPWYADAEPCREDHGWVLTLQPGESARAALVWTAELVDGVPALPGDLDFTVSVGYDPVCAPPPGFTCGPLGSRGGTLVSWGWTFKTLTVAGGFLRIVGDDPSLVTAGQAIDALLSDHRFAAWLAEEPRSTWSAASATLLDDGPARGGVPAGPSWEVNLFREKGVPRNWAIGFVDPFTARLRNLTFCNAPCGR